MSFGASKNESKKDMRPQTLKTRAMLASGVLLYAGVGVASMLMGGDFLDYSQLATDPIAGQHLGITLIEFGVGITVAGAMITIFLIFDGRIRVDDDDEDG